MTTKKLFPSRADIRGGVEGGLLDRAVVTTRAHSNFDTSAMVTGVNDRLRIEFDGGANAATINLFSASGLTAEELVALINSAFLAVGTVAFKYRGGRVQIRSPREGIGSRVDLVPLGPNGTDQEVLDLLRFDYVNTVGRTFEATQENPGLEDNDPLTRLVGVKEPLIGEVTGRSPLALSTHLDRVQGLLNSEVAIPKTFKPTASDVLTMEDLGGTRALFVTLTASAPQVGELITGATSGAQARVLNTVLDNNGVTFLIVLPVSGNFQAGGELLDGEALKSGAGFASYNSVTVTDDRIRAIKMPDRTYVGSSDYFGGTPTPDQLEQLFALSVYKEAEGDATSKNQPVDSVQSVRAKKAIAGSLSVPSYTGNRVRVKSITLGPPNEAYSPTNVYTHVGVERHAATDIDRWTKNRIYPAGGVAATVSVGDIAIITGSSDAGVPLNDGNYAIREIGPDYYEIGPSKPANSSLPEGTVLDAEIFEDSSPALSPTPPAKVSVVSPSYYLDQAADSSANDATCYLFLEEPASPQDILTVSYYEVSSLPDRAVGDPDFETPWSRHQRARLDDVEQQLQSLSAFSIIGGRLQRDRVLDLGGFREVVKVSGKGSEAETLYDFFGPARQQFVNYLSSLTGNSAGPESAPLTTSSFLDETKDTNNVGTVHSMSARAVRSGYLVIDYLPNVGTPAAGDTFTGATSGASVTVISKQLGDLVFVTVDSGVLLSGENLTGGGKQLDNILLLGYTGFRFDLPSVTSGQLATIPAGGDVVTLGGTGLPARWENIKPGDVFVPISGDLQTAGVAIRIESVNTSARTLQLEHTQPYDGTTTPFSWEVRPDIGNYVFLRDVTNGATLQAKNPYIEIEVAAGEASPQDFGAAPGDLIRATTDIAGGTSTDGTGTSYARIKRLIPRDKATATKVMIEVEESDAQNITSASNVQWEVVRTHNRTTSTRETSLILGQLGEGYDSTAGSELFLLCGPAYIEVFVQNYSAPSLGGLVGQSVVGGGDSGLNGKSLTIELWINGRMEDSETVTFVTSPGSVADLVSDLNALLTNSWMTVALSNSDAKRVVFRTVGSSSYPGAPFDGAPYFAVGPGVSLHIKGRAWDSMLAGNEYVRGNLSSIRRPVEYYERLGHVMTDGPPFFWTWEGTAYLVSPSTELGADRNLSTDPFHSGTAVVHAQNYNPQPNAGGDTTVQSNVPQSPPMPAVHVESAKDWFYQVERQEALRVSTSGQTQASLTLSGKGKQREYGHQLTREEGLGRPDAFSGEGERGEGIFSGPILIKDSWDGHSLALIITYGASTIHRQVKFTSADTNLSHIISTINSALHLTDYVECVKDPQGTGFVLRINQSNLSSSVGPYYNNRASISIDPRGTTLLNAYDNTPRTNRLLGTVPTRNQAAPMMSGLTSMGETRSMAGGLIRQRGGGRRLTVPRFKDDTGAAPGDLPAMEEVVWDEVAGSLQPMVELREGADDVVTPLLKDGRVYPMEQMESLIFYGGRKPGPARVLLYQFISSKAGAFTIGEEVEYADHTSPLLGGRARVVDQYEANGSVVSIGITPVKIKGYVVELAAVASSEAFHAGGSLVRGKTSLKSGVFHPVIIQTTNVQNDPGFGEGDQLNCSSPGDGKAVGYYAGQFVDGWNTYYVVYGSTDKWVSSAPQQEIVWRGTLKSTAAGAGTFQADIKDVIYLDSLLAAGGPVRPVAALSYRNLHSHRKDLNVPSLTSFGDVQILDKGEFLYAEKLPTNTDWPTEIRDGTTKNSILEVGRFLPHGRTFTSEVLAEGGKVVNVTNAGPTPPIGTGPGVTLPASGTMSSRTLSMVQNDLFPSMPKLRQDNAGSDGSVFWLAPDPSQLTPALTLGENRYSIVSFHVPLPAGLVWIEGFGAYVDHLDIEAQRERLYVALWTVDGLTKIPPGVRHRLEVGTTSGDMTQVDSAGGGSPNQLLSLGGYAPSWNTLGASSEEWDSFQPFPVFANNSAHSLELYVDQLSPSGKVPAPGDKLFAGTYPSPAGRETGIAYAEKYGLQSGGTENTTAYRFLTHIGESTADGTAYPSSGGGVRTYPADAVSRVEPMFMEGETVTWQDRTGTGPIGTGVIRKVDKYPHGANVRVMVYLNSYRSTSGVEVRDRCAGVYVRYRCDRLDLSRI